MRPRLAERGFQNCYAFDQRTRRCCRNPWLIQVLVICSIAWGLTEWLESDAHKSIEESFRRLNELRLPDEEMYLHHNVQPDHMKAEVIDRAAKCFDLKAKYLPLQANVLRGFRKLDQDLELRSFHIRQIDSSKDWFRERELEFFQCLKEGRDSLVGEAYALLLHRGAGAELWGLKPATAAQGH